jgi:PilZ domain
MATQIVEIPDMDFRRHYRFVCECTVHLGGQNKEELNVTDLSARGLRLHSPVSLGEGKRVEITFPNQNARVVGTVRHESPSTDWGVHIGIEFSEIQPKLVETVVASGGKS